MTRPASDDLMLDFAHDSRSRQTWEPMYAALLYGGLLAALACVVAWRLM